MEERDVIAAIGTAHGTGAVSMIRLSGKGSGSFVRFFLRPIKNDSQKKEIELPHARMTTCLFYGRVCDRIMAVRYDCGKSYTGEESVELYFHGGKKLTEEALFSLLEGGARQAEAGEFTRRAFLNGKIDLTQAEGIVDLIDGDNETALNAAFEQSEGKTRRLIEDLYQKTLALLARAEVSIDYPEEDVEEVTRAEVEKGIDDLREQIDREKKGYNASRIVREGARVALCGKVNAGKSTLFNTLLQSDRAIVSDEEGTTRDTLEERLALRGLSVVLIDTAGERQTQSDAERKGIDRSHREAETADLCITVVREDDTQRAQAEKAEDERNVLVVNCFGKVNVPPHNKQGLYLNAATGEGKEALLDLIYARCKDLSKDGGAINNARQYAALIAAENALDRAKTALKNETVDCVCADLSDALRALGSISGRDPTEDLIDEIFSRFCVGK